MTKSGPNVTIAQIIILIIICRIYNARFQPNGFSRCHCVTAAMHTSKWLNFRHSNRLVHTTRDQKLWTRNMEGFQFLGVGATEVPGENLPRRVWNQQNKFTYNHWLAALVKRKCSSTKPTRLAIVVVCHPDTEQNRPYKIPWPCHSNWLQWELYQYATLLHNSIASSVNHIEVCCIRICAISLTSLK